MGISKGYDDFICFLDDSDKKITIYVRIIEMNSFVKFETKDGNIISIPQHRVLKIKQQLEVQ